MVKKFLVPIDLAKNEIQNPQIHNLGAAPSSPVKGQMYMNTTDNTLYWWDGTAWVSARGGGTGFPGYGSITAEATFGGTSADGVAVTVARSDHKHSNPLHDAAAHSLIPLNALATATALYNMGGFKITGLGTPTAASEAAPKSYVDGVAQGLDFKNSVRVATTANGTLATAFANGQVVDGITLATNDRILLKNQTTGSENGLYTVNASGAPTRATDADASGEISPGAITYVEVGTLNGGQQWVCSATGANPWVPGTSTSTWTLYFGVTSVQAGAGLVASANVLSIVPFDTSISVNADSISVGFQSAGGTAGIQNYAARSDHNHDGTYARIFNQPVGGSVSQVVTHNLNNQMVVTEVFRNSTPWDRVECDVEHTSANSVTVRFAVAPAAAEYTVVVLG
jgi:hypothetical protein